MRWKNTSGHELPALRKGNMKTKDLIKTARLLAKEHELRRQIDDIQKSRLGQSPLISVGPMPNGDMVLEIPAVEWMQVPTPTGQERPAPYAVPLDDGKARLFYPRLWVGEYGPGKNLWVEARSEKFSLPAPAVPQTIPDGSEVAA